MLNICQRGHFRKVNGKPHTIENDSEVIYIGSFFQTTFLNLIQKESLEYEILVIVRRVIKDLILSRQSLLSFFLLPRQIKGLVTLIKWVEVGSLDKVRRGPVKTKLCFPTEVLR